MKIEIRADGAHISGYVNATEKKSRPVITPRGYDAGPSVASVHESASRSAQYRNHILTEYGAAVKNVPKRKNVCDATV